MRDMYGRFGGGIRSCFASFRDMFERFGRLVGHAVLNAGAFGGSVV